MFINCPNCSALVATDLATDLPPERCPRCGFGPLIEQVDLKASTVEPSPEPTREPVPEPEAALAPEATAPEPPPEAAPEPSPAAEPEPVPEPAPDPSPAEPDAPVPAAEVGPPIAPERHAPRFLRRRGVTAGARPGRRQVAVAAGLALLL